MGLAWHGGGWVGAAGGGGVRALQSLFFSLVFPILLYAWFHLLFGFYFVMGIAIQGVLGGAGKGVCLSLHISWVSFFHSGASVPKTTPSCAKEGLLLFNGFPCASYGLVEKLAGRPASD